MISMKYNKIIIACPISKYLTDGGINKDFEIFIKEIYSLCQNYSNKVFLALEREEYGKNKMYGADCTIADFNEMKDTDLLIAFPEDSMGVSVEIGWASMQQKEILVFIDSKYKQSELVKSINSITKGKRIDINTSKGYKDNTNLIKKYIKEYLIR